LTTPSWSFSALTDPRGTADRSLDNGARPAHNALVTRVGVGCGLALFSAACLGACGESDEVRVIDIYEVIVDDEANTLRVFAEPCGDLRVSTVESSDEVRLTVSLIAGGECVGSESPLVTLTRPLADRSIVDDPTGNLVKPVPDEVS